MKFFRKTSVAIVLTLLIVALCCVWGYTRVYVDPAPQIDTVERNSTEGNLNYYLSQIDDNADLFTLDTIDTLARKDLVLDNTYRSLLAIKTVNYLNGTDIAAYAQRAAEQMDLGDRNLLLLLDTNTEDWYVVCGSQMTAYVEADGTLPSVFHRHLGTSFWDEETDRDAAILALFEDLEDWYAEALPQYDSSTSTLFQSSKVPTVTLHALFSGILLNVLANLWWIVLLLAVLHIVDRMRFQRYFTKYPPGTTDAPLFHPFLFWHRAGSRWFEDRMDEAMHEEDEEDDDFFQGEGPYESGPGYSTDPNEPGPFGPQSGPGYSTDPNEPGPFGPQPGPQLNMDMGPAPANSLLGQLLRLPRQLWDTLARFLRRM